MAPRTDAVGKSECPIKGCKLSVPVFKYRERTPGDSTKRRFAGRLYCHCPTHGRVENQEFLLEHIEWSSGTPPENARAAPPAVDAAAGAPIAVSRARSPVAAPVKAPARAPVKPPAAAPVVTQEKPKKSSDWLPEFWK